MPEKTALELQEEKLAPMFGGPQGLNAADKSMLEISDTNRWVFDSEQSELLIALQMLHDALVAHDNRNPETIHIQDPHTGQWVTRKLSIDHWKWIIDIIYLVKTNQLTIDAFSRMQHLRQAVSMAGITEGEPERPGFFSRLFGG